MSAVSAEDKLWISRAEDALQLSRKRYDIKTLGFLNPYQRVLIEKSVFPDSDMQMFFDGGYESAERTLMVCCPEYYLAAPEDYIAALQITGRELADLSHRDYLGSLMGLGIARENIGDILVSESGASVFMKPEIAVYVLQNLSKIGRRGVTVCQCALTEIEIPERPVKNIVGTVASLRLDSVLSTALGISRSKASELIRGGMVTVNFEPTEETSNMLEEGAVLSVRGFGRMRLSEIGGMTRKGRYSITISRYV
ncbi:YlmH family RNA-binding protein [Ructibacterium gallinarum]|uniref:RNA-binding protein n=1 Tax=Ructibacterium gallinarum TaxID=2779355 RepID=A0A9D5M1N1_9FIRM|nr:YlmH/Sll1252 family protein [Ructibacterium gallinarum]MBE5040972.1 RNA-binding protein [Ructibacterium gallinarum]